MCRLVKLDHQLWSRRCWAQPEAWPWASGVKLVSGEGALELGEEAKPACKKWGGAWRSAEPQHPPPLHAALCCCACALMFRYILYVQTSQLVSGGS